MYIWVNRFLFGSVKYWLTCNRISMEKVFSNIHIFNVIKFQSKKRKSISNIHIFNGKNEFALPFVYLTRK